MQKQAVAFLTNQLTQMITAKLLQNVGRIIIMLILPPAGLFLMHVLFPNDR
jgi:hypothetical protein